MNASKLLVIDDNPDFGGHQVMAAYALDGLFKYGNWSLLGLVHPQNQKNTSKWQSISKTVDEGLFKIETAATRTRKFQAVRCSWQFKAMDALLKQIEAFKPDLVLVIQGNIEQCCSVFHLKKHLKCPLISYIPVPHKHSEMGAKLGLIRDISCRRLYTIPDGFITISKTLGDMLVNYGSKGRIQIVENGIPLEPFLDLPSKSDARSQFELPQKAFIWGQIGRIEFKQKGQDASLAAFLKRSGINPDEHLVFLGDGPDADLLKAMVADYENVHCLPWTNNPAPLYAAIDALLLPSRYEGVPLVMLEALANGLPVISTDRDGMRDWLPSEWRFTYMDEECMLRALDAARGASRGSVELLQERVKEHHSIVSFQKAFNAALEEWLTI